MWVAIVHEKGEYDYSTRYEFETAEELRNFLIAMSGVLFASEVYKET